MAGLKPAPSKQYLPSEVDMDVKGFEVMKEILIRNAVADDAATILRFIQALALYEKEPDAVHATEADILRDGWGLARDGVTQLSPAQPPRFRCVIAELAGEPVGFALYFTSYSTWEGHHGIYLEDLFVMPEHRGLGLGKALLGRVAAIAVEEGCPRLEWSVLDWNTPSIEFYQRIGARKKSEWFMMRLSGDALTSLARY
jgi:GNAT superfamily N-acetyltransferase